MKRLVLLILFLAGSASAADLVCTIPGSSVVRGLELCEEIRIALHVRAADWDNDACSSYVLRLGLIEAEKRSTRRSFNTSINTAISDAVDDLTSGWPPPTPAICGDSILDSEFGEECDPPDGGVTCDDNCQTVP